LFMILSDRNDAHLPLAAAVQTCLSQTANDPTADRGPRLGV
jgi:hypothetical protein